MPRTDDNGKQLKALLDYLLDGEVEAQDIRAALRISSSTYYRRIKEDDYPDAEELRRISEGFNLSYLDLQVRFGLLKREDIEQYLDFDAFTRTATDVTTRARRPVRLSRLERRPDVPPI